MIENKIFSKNKDSELIPNTDNKIPFENVNIIIDMNGFQKKRIENVHAIVHMMAERARYF